MFLFASDINAHTICSGRIHCGDAPLARRGDRMDRGWWFSPHRGRADTVAGGGYVGLFSVMKVWIVFQTWDIDHEYEESTVHSVWSTQALADETVKELNQDIVETNTNCLDNTAEEWTVNPIKP